MEKMESKNIKLKVVEVVEEVGEILSMSLDISLVVEEVEGMMKSGKVQLRASM